MPWRENRDPYRIWVSEVMLQQTTVKTVIPYYEAFLARFEGIEQLAAAREEDVLALWSGLGYYHRARSLHRAAKNLVASFGGRFPRTLEAAGLHVKPYVATRMGFNLAAARPFDPERIRLGVPTLYLTDSFAKSMFRIPGDLGPMPVEVNRIESHAIVGYVR